MPTLVLAKTAPPGPVTVGQPLTYTITVTNIGPGAAAAVVLTDVLPPGVTFNTASVPCTPAGNILTCPLGTIAQGSAVTVQITVTPTAPGTLVNVASAQGTDTNVAQGSAQTVVLAQAADLAVTKTASPNPAIPGRTVAFTVTVVNNGPSPATGVTLVDRFSPNLFFISATSTQGTCTRSGVTLTCLLGNLAVGATAIVTIVGTPRVRGALTNTAMVQGDQFDPNPENNTATVTINACPPVNPCCPCPCPSPCPPPCPCPTPCPCPSPCDVCR
jgi:uncharacterized repeat protein (TIGR01451 family)